MIYSKEDREIAENPDNAYQLIYGLNNPTKENLAEKIISKLAVCDSYYIPFFNEHISNKKEKTLLEFGSGFGDMAKYLSPLFKKVICVDVNEHYLNQCRKYTKECNNIEFFLLNDYYFNGVDLKPRSIDIVKSTNVFIHLNIYEFVIYLQNFNRLLKEDGLLIFDIYDSDLFSWNHRDFSKHVNNYKKQGKLKFTFIPISGKRVKEEVVNMGFELIYEEQNSNGTNILGFKKLKKLL